MNIMKLWIATVEITYEITRNLVTLTVKNFMHEVVKQVKIFLCVANDFVDKLIKLIVLISHDFIKLKSILF